MRVRASSSPLAGISDTTVSKIIADRPYNSKSAIVTDGIVPAGTYVTDQESDRAPVGRCHRDTCATS